MPDDGAPAGFVPYPVTVREGRKGGDEPERNGDGPREGEPQARMCGAATEDDEDAEPGSNDRSGASETEAWTSFDPRDLAIRDDVAEVRRELHPERDG